MKKIKRVKMKAVILEDGSLYGLYDTPEEAKIQNRTALNGNIGKIVSATISYFVPKKKRGVK